MERREIRKKNKNKVSPLERDTQEKQGLTAGHCPPPTHTHQALLDYRVIKSNTKLAGISGGAVASTLLAAVASTYVPCTVGGQVATLLRGKAWIDDGAGTPLEALCEAMGAAAGPACVHIIAVTLGPLGDPSCRPPLRAAGPATPGAYPGYPAYPPAPASPALKLSCEAYKAANGGRGAYSDFAPMQVPLVPGAICPGCRVRTPLTQCDLANVIKFNLTGATLAAKTRQVWNVVQLGYDEGAAWAKEAGYRRFF